ncbi:MAG: hypothetical protein WD336_04660 [Trueperaceae bacterium]
MTSRRGVVLVAVLLAGAATLAAATATLWMASVHLAGVRWQERELHARAAGRAGVLRLRAWSEREGASGERWPDAPPWTWPDDAVGEGTTLRWARYRPLPGGGLDVEIEAHAHGATTIVGARLPPP